MFFFFFFNPGNHIFKAHGNPVPQNIITKARHDRKKGYLDHPENLLRNACSHGKE